MKNINKIIIAFTLLMNVLITSCNDSGLLDKTESGDTLTEDQVFGDAILAGKFLTDIYRRMPNGWIENVYLDAASDIGESRPWSGWVNVVHNGGFSASNMPTRLNRWADYYAAIRACNKFLEKIDSVPANSEPGKNAYGQILNEQVRMKRKGEAYALRAYFYSELLKCYGGVPIINKVLNIDSPELYSSRASLKQMLDQILMDCDSAITKLPFKATGDEYPRMTAMIVKGIKARSLLVAASPIFNDINDSYGNPIPENSPYGWGNYDKDRWKKAADAALEVINFVTDPTEKVPGKYGLVVDVDQGNFANVNTSYPGHKNAYGWYKVFVMLVNSEVFIANPYKGNTNELEKWQMPGTFDGNRENAFTLPTMNYVALFENNQGVPVYLTDENNVPIYDETTNNFKLNPKATIFNPQKPYDNLDNRFYHSVWYQGSKFNGKTINCWRSSDGRFGDEWQKGYANTGLFLRKFLDPIAVTLNAGGNITGQTSHRYPLMRYAEFILDYAEPMNEYLEDGADRSLIITQMNKLRTRAWMPNVTTTFAANGWGITNKVEMRKFIRCERAVELAFEDSRYYDIKRWKIGEQTQKTIYGQDILLQPDGTIKYSVKVLERRVYEPKHNLFPIPQGEINNNHNLVQNPGW